MTKTQQQFGTQQLGTLKTWLLSLAGLIAVLASTSVAQPAMAQSTQTTSPDANPGTAWSIRENYFKRYKWAEEFYRSDVVQNGESQGPGTVTPNSGPVYKWPATVEQGQPSQVPTRRDEAIQKYQVTTFGYPVSDTQFQTIQRLNDNMMLEEAFDPERWMWMENAVGAIKATSAANSLANLERNQATSAINLTKMFLDNFTVDPGNVWNRIRNELFIPMAFLLLLPGAVLSQVRAIIAQGNPVLGPVNPFDGILRSIVAVFLIPSTYLVVNYSIDFANSVTYEIQQGYARISGGGDMYQDAVTGHNRAFPIRTPDSNRNAIPPAPTTNNNPQGQGDPISTLESISFDVGAESGDPNKADEVSPVLKSTQRALVNGANGALAGTWNVLCAFQMAYLYYLFCIGPVVAALWVWPMGQLRGAFASWVEGVITLCFWSLFWNTTVLLMACFRSSGETGTVVMSALNFLSIASVRHAFDFAGLVKAAGDKVGQEIKKGQSGGGKGGNAQGADKGADSKGGSSTSDGKGGTSTSGDGTSGSGTNGGSSTSATSNATATNSFLSNSTSNGLGMQALGVDAGLPPTADSNPGALNLPGSDVKGGGVEAAPPPLSSALSSTHLGATERGQALAGVADKTGADKTGNSELHNLGNGQNLFGHDVSHLTQDMPLIGPDANGTNGSNAANSLHAASFDASNGNAINAIGLPPGADSNTFVANNAALNGFDVTPGTNGFVTNNFGANGFGQDGTHGITGIHGNGANGTQGVHGHDGLLTGAQGVDKFGTVPGSTSSDSANHPFFTANGEGLGGKNGTAFDALTGSASPFSPTEATPSTSNDRGNNLVLGNGDNAARGLSNLIDAANGSNGSVGPNGAPAVSQDGTITFANGPLGSTQDNNVLSNVLNGSNGTQPAGQDVVLNNNGSFSTAENAFVGGIVAGVSLANGGSDAVGPQGQIASAQSSYTQGSDAGYTSVTNGTQGATILGGETGTFPGAPNSTSNGTVDSTSTFNGTANAVSSEAVAFVGGMAVGAMMSGGNSDGGASISQGISQAASYVQGENGSYTTSSLTNATGTSTTGTSTTGDATYTGGGSQGSSSMIQEATAFVGGMAVGLGLGGGNGGEQSAPTTSTFSVGQGDTTGQGTVGNGTVVGQGQGQGQGSESTSFFSNPGQAIENATAFVGGMAVGAMMSGGESPAGAVNSTFSAPVGGSDASSSVSGQPTQGTTSGDSTSFFSNPGQSIENAAAFVGGMAVGAMMSGAETVSNAVGFSSDASSSSSANAVSSTPQGSGESTSFFSNPVQSIENAASFVGGMVVGAMMNDASASNSTSSSSFFSSDASNCSAPAQSSGESTSFFSNPVQAIENAASYVSNAVGSFVNEVGSSAAASFTSDLGSSGNGGTAPAAPSYSQDAPASGGTYSGGSYAQDTSSYSGATYSASYSSYDSYAPSTQGYSSTPAYDAQPNYNAPLPTPVNDGPQYGAPAPAPAQNFEAAPAPSYQPAPQSYDAPQSYAPQSYAPTYSDAPQASYAPSYAQNYDANAYAAPQQQQQQPQPVAQHHEQPVQPAQAQPQFQPAAPEQHAPQFQPVAYDPGAVQSFTAAANSYVAPEAAPQVHGGQYQQAAEGTVRHDYQSGPAVAHSTNAAGGSAPTITSHGPATSSSPSGHGNGSAPSHGPAATESVIVHSNGQRDGHHDDQNHLNNGQQQGNDLHNAWNQQQNGDAQDQRGPLGSLFGAAAALRRGQNGTGDKAAANSLLNALGKAATNKPTSQQLNAQGVGNKPAAQANASLEAQLQGRAPQHKKDKEREEELDEELVRIEEYAKNQNWA